MAKKNARKTRKTRKNRKAQAARRKNRKAKTVLVAQAQHQDGKAKPSTEPPTLADRFEAASKLPTEEEQCEAMESIRGYPPALNRAGEFYRKRYLQSKDPRDAQDAMKAFLKASVCLRDPSLETNYLPAYINLGFCFMYGHGVEKNSQRAEYWFRKAAERGHPSAQNQLGFLLLGKPGKHTEAIQLLKESAQQEHPSGLNNLGHAYREGLGTTRDYKKAFECFLRAYELDHTNASVNLNLGFSYDRGLGVAQDKKKAKEHYRIASNRGNSRASALLGKIYEDQEGYVSALQLYKQAAPHSHWAKNRLAHLISEGKGTKKNEEEALRLYTKTAEADNPTGMFFVGNNCRDRGQYSKATEWYKKAAMKDHAPSSVLFGDCLMQGIGIKKDVPRALSYYKTTAESGYRFAQFRMGRCYLEGRGVERDDKKAFQWFQKAALQKRKYFQAEEFLAYAYDVGCGIGKDPVKARYWLHQAAMHGSAMAQCHLGIALRYGINGEPNMRDAYIWLQKSANQGYAAGQHALGDYRRVIDDDNKEAFWYYSKSAAQNYKPGQDSLAMCHLMGIGTTLDFKQAMFWFSKSKSPSALCNIGCMYALGQGVPANALVAVEYLKRAAAKGSTPALYFLGSFHKKGFGFREADEWLALSCYRQAAEKGCARSKIELRQPWAKECFESLDAGAWVKQYLS